MALLGLEWEDFRLGVHDMNMFERIAIVSDKNWILSSISFLSSMIPCSIRTYQNSDLSDACAWLDSGDIGFEHKIDEERGIVTVEIHAPLGADNFYLLSHTVDEWIGKNEHLNGLVIHTKDFPGWENIGSFISHISFVKNHHRKISKVALVADTKLAELVPRLASHFVEAQIQQFSYNDIEEAKNWASKS